MTNDGNIQSVERAVELVELLVGHEGGLRLKELAEYLGVQPPTARNLLRTLEKKRLVARSGMLYVAGPVLTEWAVVLESREWIQRCGEGMSAIVERFPSAVSTLAQAVGGSVRVRLRMSPDRRGILQRPADVTFGMYSSISALVVQAYSGPEQVAELRRHTSFLEYGSHLWKSESKLESFLAETRKLGYGVMPFDTERWLRVAVPVWQAGHHLAGVVGISMPVTGETPVPAEVANHVTMCVNQAKGE